MILVLEPSVRTLSCDPQFTNDQVIQKTSRNETKIFDQCCCCSLHDACGQHNNSPRTIKDIHKRERKGAGENSEPTIDLFRLCLVLARSFDCKMLVERYALMAHKKNPEVFFVTTIMS